MLLFSFVIWGKGCESHGACVLVRGQFGGNQFSPFSMWVSGSNSGFQSWQQAPLFTLMPLEDSS